MPYGVTGSGPTGWFAELRKTDWSCWCWQFTARTFTGDGLDLVLSHRGDKNFWDRFEARVDFGFDVTRANRNAILNLISEVNYRTEKATTKATYSSFLTQQQELETKAIWEFLRVGGASRPRLPGMMFTNPARRPKAPPTFSFGIWNQENSVEPETWNPEPSPLWPSTPPGRRPAGRWEPGRASRKLAQRPGTQERRRPTASQNRPNNVLTDRDGNVFRKDQNGNWQQREGGQWKQAQNLDRSSRPSTRPSTAPNRASQPSTRPSTQPSARPSSPTTRQARPSTSNRSTRPQLERDMQARQRSVQRNQNFNRSRQMSRPGGGRRR